MPKTIPSYALFGDDESPEWRNSFFFEKIPQRARPYQFSIRPHTHSALIQILLLTQGSVEAVVDHAKFTLAAPALLLVPANTVHGWSFSPDVDGPIVTAAQRPLESLAHVLMPALAQVLRTPSHFSLALRDEACEELLQTFGAIELEARHQAIGHTAAGLSLVIALVVKIVRLQDQMASAASPTVPRRAEQVAKFRALVEQHFNQHWSIKDYAGQIGITAGQLTRACRETLGKSGIEVVHARLAQEAQRELVYTTGSIRQIADRLGFSDEAYFSRFFRNQTTLTPREFRKLAMQDVLHKDPRPGTAAELP